MELRWTRPWILKLLTATFSSHRFFSRSRIFCHLHIKSKNYTASASDGNLKIQNTGSQKGKNADKAQTCKRWGGETLPFEIAGEVSVFSQVFAEPFRAWPTFRAYLGSWCGFLSFFHRSSDRSLGGIGGFVFWISLAALNYLSPERVWETVKDFLLFPYTLDAEASWTVFTHFSGFAIFVFLADR